MGGARQTALFALAAFAATVATFAPSAWYEFVRIDDHEYVTENRHIARGLTWDAAKWAFSDVGYASNCHPLTWMCHALDVSVARALGVVGDAPQDRGAAWVANGSGLAKVSHVHNVLLHGLNAALLFLVMARMVGGVSVNRHQSSIILIATMLWALHPLRCEAVCWVSERKELLSVFWMLAALALWVRGSNAAKPSIVCHLTSIIFAALALMAKPVAVSLPVVIFAYEWMMRRVGFRLAALRALPFAALSAVVCVLTLRAQTEGLESGQQYGWLMRLECALEAPAVYLRQTLMPTGLSPVYLRSRATDWALLVAGCAVMAAMVWIGARWLRRREKWCGAVAFGVVWAYAALVPMLGIVKVGGMAHSDRYTYWPGCGVAFAVAAGLAILADLSRFEMVRHVRWAGGAAVALAAALGMARSACWRDTVTLYRDTVAKSHDAEIAFELADELMRAGGEVRTSLERKREAEAMLRETVSANPDPKAYAALAHFLAFHSSGEKMMTDPGAGAFSEARALAGRALAAEPGCWIAHAALTACDARDGRWRDAVAHGEAAIRSGACGAGFAELVEECRGKACGAAHSPSGNRGAK